MTMFSKRQRLPWWEKRSGLDHALRRKASVSSKRSVASSIGIEKPANSLSR